MSLSARNRFMMKKVLFVGHGASQTGAPMLLLHFMRWLRNNTSLQFDVLLLEGGPLEVEYEEITHVYRIPGYDNGAVGRAFRRWPGAGRIISTRQKLSTWRLCDKLARQDYGLIYANTAASWRALRFLKSVRASLLLHVHELESEIMGRVGLENFAHLKSRASIVVACSDAVKAYLVNDHDIRPESVRVVHEFVPDIASPHANTATVQQELNLPANARVVGACGTVDLRKGADLLVPLALCVKRQMPGVPVHFVWVGDFDLNGRDQRLILADARKCGLDDRVHFIGPRRDALPYMRCFDLFVMLSREDPFPLVNLEVASLGKPIVCFQGAGGSPELVKDDAGFVVPYLDLEAMTDRIVQLLQQEEMRRRLGHAAQRRMLERHQLSVAAPDLWSLIQSFLECKSK